MRGVVDPCNGRLVLHGHITARNIIARGPLQQPQYAQSSGVRGLSELIQRMVQEQRGRVHGAATFEIKVNADGVAQGVRTLVDRILPLPGGGDRDALVARIGEQLSTLRFDPAGAESTLGVPFVFQ